MREILDAAQRRSTPEQQERVRQLRRASEPAPSLEREAARAEIAMHVHGIGPGWACSCGLGYEYPNSRCRCGATYPRRCITPGCGVLVQTAGSARCWDCGVSAARQGRALAYASSQIPPGPRRAATNMLAHQQQADALREVRDWVGTHYDAVLWKREKTPYERDLAVRSALFLFGQPGLGKSTLAAFAVHLAFVERGFVSHFNWHSQAHLAELHRAMYAGDDESRARAVNEWRAVVESPLLVLDELFGDRMTPGFAEEMARLVRERLDYLRPTLITSNIAPQWQTHFEFDVGRIESRWRAAGKVVALRGQDLRRAA